MYLASNLASLRKYHQKTQEEIASALKIDRTRYLRYEKGIGTPNLNLLKGLSDYFKVSIDNLIRMDLSKFSALELFQLSHNHWKGAYLRVLPTTISEDGRENIELVTEKAKAGYKAGYADQEYIGQLPTFRLPFLHPERKYRAFPVSGDSMLPIPDGAYVIGEYVVDWHEVKTGWAYILLTREDGIVFKRIGGQSLEINGMLLLESLNTDYKPYELSINDVIEIWKFHCYISRELPDFAPAQQVLLRVVKDIEQDVKQIKKGMNL